jgi:polyisoprenoid-binding protein YceI
MTTQQFNIIPAQSSIDWTGRKVTGAHNGTIAIKEGILEVSGNKLSGGAFVADTTAINILDITDPATNAQFAGHLASADFFASEQYPEARFEIALAEPAGDNSYVINGHLTIKGITHPLSFPALVNISDEVVTASGKIVVDRTRYDMKFRSGNFFTNLGDTLIYNNFDLQVNITAKAVVHRQQDSAAIAEVLEKYYFAGIYEGKPDLLHKTYHSGTLLFGDVKGVPYAKTLDQYLDGVTNRQSPKDSGKPFKGEIISIKQVNSIAVAEVKVKMYDFLYHEFLSLHKLNGSWLIVNKMISDVNQ